MKLIERVKNKVFKSNLSCSVEYHAGGFFVRKQVAYLIFTNTNNVLFYEREEGLHPNDNNYILLINEVVNKNKGIVYEVSQPKDSINEIKLICKDETLLIMPSVFIENLIEENLTEIIVDKIKGKQNIFDFVFNIPTPV